MANSEQTIPTPYAQRVTDFRRRTLPLLVWVVAVLACVGMFYGRTQRFEYVGIAEAMDYEISARARGQLRSVPVALFEDVSAGDVVATLDDDALLASLETARTTILMLEADLEAARAQSSTGGAEMTSDLRRFQIDEERRRLEILSLRVVIETDEVERESLDLEVTRNRQLLNAGFLSQAEFDSVRLSRDRLDVALESNRNLLAQSQNEYAAARARRENFERGIQGYPESEPLLQPLRRAIEVEAVRLNEIEVERKSLVLRSPVTGRVSQLLCHSGQSVVPGEPILIVTEAAPHEIVAWMPEHTDELARGRSRVLVASRNDRRKVAESVVVRTSPSIQPLPERLWRNPRIPDYGRAVVIAGVPALDLTPGELVTVRFKRE